jgi:hypothetical protein
MSVRREYYRRFNFLLELHGTITKETSNEVCRLSAHSFVINSVWMFFGSWRDTLHRHSHISSGKSVERWSTKSMKSIRTKAMSRITGQ